MVEITESGRIISIEDLLQFEQINEITLPLQYKHFLLKYNGGRPKPDNVIIPEWAGVEAAVHFFKSIDYSGTNLQWWRNECKDELKNNYLVFAICPYGNSFVIGINSENYGKVFFWDSSLDFAEENDGKTIYFLADTFNEFIGLIHEYKV